MTSMNAKSFKLHGSRKNGDLNLSVVRLSRRHVPGVGVVYHSNGPYRPAQLPLSGLFLVAGSGFWARGWALEETPR